MRVRLRESSKRGSTLACGPVGWVWAGNADVSNIGPVMLEWPSEVRLVHLSLYLREKLILKKITWKAYLF